VIRLPAERLELAARSVPARPEAPLLGDAWHWARLPSGVVHLAVVDAEGHGHRAHRRARALVAAVASAAALAPSPAAALAQAALRVLPPPPDPTPGPGGLATALVAHLHPHDGTCTLASAGHLPPLLVPADGVPARYLPVPGVALGSPGGGPGPEVRLSLAEGDLLVLYTDGLVEHAGDLVAGLRDLRHRASCLGGRPLALEVVVEALAAPLFGPRAHRDDGLVVALRRQGGRTSRSDSLEPAPGPRPTGVLE
jgi:serine phosphatase RsbU (regulator of sigma subunit)